MGCIKLTIRSDGEQGSKLRHYLNSAFNHEYHPFEAACRDGDVIFGGVER